VRTHCEEQIENCLGENVSTLGGARGEETWGVKCRDVPGEEIDERVLCHSLQRDMDEDFS
jgi:hypothetical protein